MAKKPMGKKKMAPKFTKAGLMKSEKNEKSEKGESKAERMAEKKFGIDKKMPKKKATKKKAR